MRLRLVAVAAGFGAVCLCLPVVARTVPEPAAEALAKREPNPGLPILQAAARVQAESLWSGTQRIVTAAPGMTSSRDVQVTHIPGHGSDWQDSSGTARTADVLDPSLLMLLEANYDVHLVGPSTCSGREAQRVDVLRPGTVGAGSVAARFWVDAQGGLLLRRDVFDLDGSLLRSVTLRDVQIGPGSVDGGSRSLTPSSQDPLRPHGRHVPKAGLALLAKQGWPVPTVLPRGFSLYDARQLDAGMLQLAYSDGLATTSLFVQQGTLPAATHGQMRSVQGVQVWQGDGDPTRMAWQAGDHVFTMVSDATSDAREAAVAALPHETHSRGDDGVAARAWRGLERVGSWLNPFG